MRQGSPSQDGPILFTELFDDNYNLQMDGSDLQKWPELTNYCNSYDIGLRLTGTYILTYMFNLNGRAIPYLFATPYFVFILNKV